MLILNIEFAFDLGAEFDGPSTFCPDYMLPRPDLRAPFVAMPEVMYERSHRIRVTKGESLGQIFDPYFNRTWEHFCSHQHTPNHEEPSGFDCGVRHGNILYFAHPVFRHYRAFGAVAYREFIVRAIHGFLGDAITLSTNLPSTARISLTAQPAEKRHILHLLYAPTVSRGGVIQLSGGNTSGGRSVEVIEDLPPLCDIEVTLAMKVKSARLVPEGRELPVLEESGKTVLRIDRFACHQIVEMH